MDLKKLNLTQLSAREQTTTAGGGPLAVFAGAFAMYVVMNWADVEDGWNSVSGSSVSY
jgi:hypothetical protein